MERVRVGDLNDSPYGGARFLYNNCSDTKTETVDLLRMVPTKNRPGILKNADNGMTLKEAAEHIDMDLDSLDNGKVMNTRRGSRKSLGEVGHRCKTNNNTGDNVSIEMMHGGTGSLYRPDASVDGGQCPAQRNLMVYCSREALEDEHPHLCQKHARELLDNQTNTLYDHHQQRAAAAFCGDVSGIESPYYSKLPQVYNNGGKANYDTEGRAAGSNVHFNYLKQMKHQPKDNTQSRSTLSLPAVTYTFGKKGRGNKNIFRKTSNFFKPSSRDVGNSYAPTDDFLDSKGATISSSSNDGRKLKRLLLVACILLGVVLALGGIIVGFVILQNQKATEQDCGPDFVDCGPNGCVHLDYVCNDVTTHCPGYTLGVLCQRTKQENSSIVPPEGLSDNKSTSVISNFVFDESDWVHFTNFSGAESMYKVIDRYMTFTSAQEECRQYGGHLAHVTSIREQVFLEDYLRSQFPTAESLSGVRGFWIGARRQRGSNMRNCMHYRQWRWLDSYGRTYGVVEGFSSFKDGKPDNFYNPEECLFLNTDTVEPGVFDESFLKWDDVACDNQGQGGLKPLCEVDLKKYSS